jgi:hypothetical protein
MRVRDKTLLILNMTLFVKLTVLEFISTFLIVACTRAYVKADYGWTFVTEALWLTQWFAMQKLMIEDPRSRSWKYGYWAFQIGTLSGAMVAIWLTKRLYGG